MWAELREEKKSFTKVSGAIHMTWQHTSAGREKTQKAKFLICPMRKKSRKRRGFWRKREGCGEAFLRKRKRKDRVDVRDDCRRW